MNFYLIFLYCSLTSEKKFDGAEGNLKKILEKVVNAPPLQQTEMKEEKLMALSLMKLLNELIYEESTKNLSNVSTKSKKKIRQNELCFAMFSLKINQKFSEYIYNFLLKVKIGLFYLCLRL
mgnify:CR=1 FL=1